MSEPRAVDRLADWLAEGRSAWLYACDPAGTTCLRLVEAALQARGVSATWITEGWCRETGAVDGLSWDAVEASAAQGGRCLAGAQYDFPRNRAALRRARALGLETLYLFDTWAHYVGPFLGAGAPALADRIGVPDALARDQARAALEAAGLDAAQRLWIVGHPDLEAVAAAVEATAPETIAAYRRAQGAEDGALWLFLTEPVEADGGLDAEGQPRYGLTEFTVLEHFLRAMVPPETTLVVRPHPRQDVAALEARIAAMAPACTVAIDGTATLAVQIAAADRVYGIFTSALLAAKMAGKPATSLQMGRNEEALRFTNPHLERMLAPLETDA